MFPTTSKIWDNEVGMPINPEIKVKSKRMVYKMKKLLQTAEVDDDFDKTLQTLTMSRVEKNIAMEEYSKIREAVRKSLKKSVKDGQPSEFLAHLRPAEFEKFRKQALEMLMSSAGGRNLRNQDVEESDRDSRYGEEIVAGRIQVISGHRDSQKSKKFQNDDDFHPEPPRPQGIPKLDVGMLREESEFGKSDDDFSDLKSGDPIPSPFDAKHEQSRKTKLEVSDRKMAELLTRLDRAEKQNKRLEKQVEEEKKKRRVIVSRPRDASRHEIAVQTFEEVPQRREIMVQTSDLERVETQDAGIDIQSISDPKEFLKKTPRVEEDEDSGSNYSDMSEGEIRMKVDPPNLITVRSDGQVVPNSQSRNIPKPANMVDGAAQTSQRTPRVEEHYEDEELLPGSSLSSLLRKDENVLISGKSNLDVRVAERTISSSSIDAFLSPASLESSLNYETLKQQKNLMSKSAEPIGNSQEGLKHAKSANSLPPIRLNHRSSSKMYGGLKSSDEEGEDDGNGNRDGENDADDEAVSV